MTLKHHTSPLLTREGKAAPPLSIHTDTEPLDLIQELLVVCTTLSLCQAN